MSKASKYWTLVKLESSGRQKRSEIAAAKAFFESAFPEFLAEADVPDVPIQKQLVQWLRDANSQGNNINSQNAECCLLCFISWEIEQVCLQLAQQFGTYHGFRSQDLFPFVLDEEGINRQRHLGQTKTPYQSFAREILQTFDPQQSSLATWTNRRVKFNSEINKFLLEHGVYLVSDWAILNDTHPQQLEKILTQFYQLTSLEVEQRLQLLACYHSVYRSQRLQQRQAGARKRCQPPTAQQYQQIAQRLETLIQQRISPKAVAWKLQNLATLLRQYRTYIRGGKLPNQSLIFVDDSDSIIEQIPSPEPIENDEEDIKKQEFLNWYEKQFLMCLHSSIGQVLETGLTTCQKRDGAKAEQFLTALYLFHCQGQSMSEIAATLGLKAQYQVTRLLKLKAFRADVRHHLLLQLRDRILEYTKPEHPSQELEQWEKQIELALDGELETLFKQAESDSYIAQNRPLDSPFFKGVCYYLDLREKSPNLIQSMISLLSKNSRRSY